MPELSIVIPTYNRAPLLARCLASIAATVQADYEIIVVNGASTDATRQVLEQHQSPRLKVIHEPQRQGFVKAVNQGFRAAEGKYLTWLNDDARPLGNCYESAIYQLSAAPDAVLALFHHWHSTRNVAYETTISNKTYRLCHVRGTLYANFGLALRQTFQQLDYFDERYYLNAADPDFSLKAWHAGRPVLPAFGALIDHEELADARRMEDSPRAAEDNAKLFAKWNLPPKNLHRNDFDPAHPCTLSGLNGYPLAEAA